MNLIYANQDKTDIGVLEDYTLDLAYGVSENDFSLTLDLGQHCCEDDYIIYMTDTQDGVEQPTEYGGIIDTISVNTSAHTVTYSGRTWHGILSQKILSPDDGQDYLVVSGNAHDIIRSLLYRIGLNDFFTVETEKSPVNIPKYQFVRYVDAYEGICSMLAANGGKLLMRYSQKHVVLSVVWLIDFSQSDEWDSSQVNFTISQTQNPLNHLVCLGQGELRKRHVIHLFTDENGGVQPYATTSNPVKDSDYILDKRNQVLFGDREIAEVYDNSTAATVENYVLMTSQPSDWSRNYSKYYMMDANGEFTNPEATEETLMTVLTQQPADWATAYSNYMTSDGNSVQGIETEAYVALTKKPADWEKNYGNYFVHFWDGTQYSWQRVSGVTEITYVPQTKAPSDWKTNCGRYYTIKYEEKILYVLNGKSYIPKKVKYGVGYTNVQKVKKGTKETAPKWKKGRYYTSYSNTYAPSYESGILPKYKLDKNTIAPTWAANTYYTKIQRTVLPVWKTGVYYRKYEDHYAELITYAKQRLEEARTAGDAISINLDLLGEYDIGDIVGANENVTGVSVWQAITKKIINIKSGKRTISYKIGVEG